MEDKLNKEAGGKLTEKTEQEEEQKFPFKFFLILVVVFIVVFLVVFVGVKMFYKFNPVSYPTMEYNGFQFQQIAGVWHTDWQHNNKLFMISLRFNPKEVMNVPKQGQLNDTFKQKNIYITFDPEEDTDEFKYLALAVSELTLNLYKALGKEAVGACTKNVTKACENRPIVDCDSDDKAVILLKGTGESNITFDGNCMILEGNELDLLKSVDRILYIWFKIMKF